MYDAQTRSANSLGGAALTVLCQRGRTRSAMPAGTALRAAMGANPSMLLLVNLIAAQLLTSMVGKADVAKGVSVPSLTGTGNLTLIGHAVEANRPTGGLVSQMAVLWVQEVVWVAVEGIFGERIAAKVDGGVRRRHVTTAMG